MSELVKEGMHQARLHDRKVGVHGHAAPWHYRGLTTVRQEIAKGTLCRRAAAKHLPSVNVGSAPQRGVGMLEKGAAGASLATALS